VHGGTAPTTAAVTIAGNKWDGVSNRNAMTAATDIVLDIENNYATAGSGGLLMRVMGNGAVGIGDTTPDYVLDLERNNPTNGWMLQLENTYNAGGSGSGAWIRYDLSDGSDDWGEGVDPIGWSVYNITDSNYRLTVDQSGQVGIGMNGAALSYLLHLGSDSAGKPNGGSWSNSSDARIKKNVAPISGALDKITKLQGVQFEWVNPDEHGNGVGLQGGFIAQDIEKVFPDWIKEIAPTPKDAALVSDTGQVKSLTLPFEFDAYMVEAIKEQQGEIEALRAENDALKARLDAIEKKLNETP